MSVLPYSFLLFLCLHVLTEATRHERPRRPPPSPPPARRGQKQSGRSSGELSTLEGHRCTWQTSGEDPVTLLVDCSTDTEGDLQRYWCRFAGNPSLCPTYGVKSSSYWKQLVGKLKKRQNACEGEKILRAKTCKKGGEGAHMKLTQRGGGGGEKHWDGGRRKEEEERRRFEGNRVMNDVDPVETYCGEGWSSICAFFIKMFQG